MNTINTTEIQETNLEQLLHDTGHLWYVDIFAQDTINLPFDVAFEQFKKLLESWFVNPVFISRSDALLKTRREKLLERLALTKKDAEELKMQVNQTLDLVKITTKDIKEILRKIRGENKV